MRNKIKELNEKFIYEYKGHKINVVLLILSSILVSRILIYAVFQIWLLEGNSNHNIFAALNKWDASWYYSIMAKGYDLIPYGNDGGDAANWAFFPLYPMMIRYIGRIIKIDMVTMGSIVSTVFFILSLIIGYLYIVETRRNKKLGIFYVLIMTFGMYSFYFSIVYTEALYIFLLSLSLYLLYKKKYILMGIIGALLSATRNMGVMLVFAVAAQYTAEYLKRDDKSITGYFVTAFKKPDFLLGISLIPAGLFSYMTYLKRLTGDYLAFAHIQVAWGRENSNPILKLIKETLKALLHLDKFNFYFCAWAGVAILISIYLAIEKRYYEAILGIIFILIPLSSGFQSIPRYIVGSFVFALGFIDILNKINSKMK